jgi:hypothetical protein
MNHPIENRYRYGLVYNLDGQIVGFNLSPDAFVGFTDEEIEKALEAYVKRKYELPSVQPEKKVSRWKKGVGENGVTTSLFCSLCYYENKQWEKHQYCPNCGAKMEEGE